MTICHVYADVGPQGLDGFPHHRQRGRGDEIMGADAEWMHRSIHTSFVRLTQRVPMVQVNEFPEAMQRQVVGVPRAWVRLFHQIARAVVCYHDHHPPPPEA